MRRPGRCSTSGWAAMSTEAAGLCAGLARPVRATYEAGPTGYGLARELARAPGRVCRRGAQQDPRASGDRVKTDRRDAEHLVRLLLAGKLHAVRVPGHEEEALRDLVRAREAVRVDLMRCRHRLSKSCCCVTAFALTTGGRGASVTARGWHRSSWAGPRRRRRCSTRVARSTRSCIAAISSSVRSSRCCLTRPGRCRSAGCAVCAASTRSQPPGCARRSLTSSASPRPRS